MLEYKARRHGRAFGKTGRFEPTSQVCSACGVKDGPKPLSVREWTCGGCGSVHDRDVNAARNIAALGHREAQNACGDGVTPPLTVAAVSKQEPSEVPRERHGRESPPLRAERMSKVGRR